MIISGGKRMKVIFRSNDHFAKKSLRNNADVWVESLEKYLSEAAILRLDLFVNQNNVAKASLNIVDKDLHVYASHEDVSFSVALDSVVQKCAKQIIKNQLADKSYKETIRYNDEYNVSFDGLGENIELNTSINSQFEMLDIEHNLTEEKKTPKYNRIMNKYINYLYRKNDIEQAEEHLRILYSILDNVNLEEISVAEYARLTESIVQVEKERNAMITKQCHFETNTKDKLYVDHIIEEEASLAKLKK